MELEEAHPVQATAVKFKIVGRQWPPFSIFLDVYSEETCTDITEELLGYILDGADKPLRLHLYECWRGRERRIHRDENVLDLVRKWGCPGDYKLVGRLLCDNRKAKKKKKPPLDLRRLTEPNTFINSRYNTKTLVKIRDGLRKLATRKQMELDSVMLERLKTQGPLWGPRDPTAPQEEELERLRRDNLQIATDITDLNIVRSDLFNQIEIATQREQKLQQAMVTAETEMGQLELRVRQAQELALTEISSLKAELEQQDQLSTLLRSKLQLLQDGPSQLGSTPTPLVQKSTSLAQGSTPLVQKSTSLAQGSTPLVQKSTSLAQGSTPLVQNPRVHSIGPEVYLLSPRVHSIGPKVYLLSSQGSTPLVVHCLTSSVGTSLSALVPETPLAMTTTAPNRTPSTTKKRQSSLFAVRMKQLMDDEGASFKMKVQNGVASSGSGHKRKLDFDDEKTSNQATSSFSSPAPVVPRPPSTTVAASSPGTVPSIPLHHLQSPKERLWYLNTSQDGLQDVAHGDCIATSVQPLPFDYASQEGMCSQPSASYLPQTEEDRLWYLSTSQDDRGGVGFSSSQGFTPSPLPLHRVPPPAPVLSGGPNRLHPQKRVRFEAGAIILDAALEGQLDVLQQCVRELGTFSIANDNGITCLHNAACSGSLETVQYLVEMGCDVNAQDVDQCYLDHTPFCYLDPTSSCYLDLSNILLLPRTPLHCAVAYGHLEVIKLLVQNGGALYLETWCGDTALQIAMKECNDLHSQSSQDILQYLRGVYDSVGVVNKGLVYTLFARQAATSEELSFEEGELLKVLERGGGSRGNQWWLAECADGSEGRVPCTHLGITGRYRVSL
ncbi:hypothetical protein EMCRGX_G031423 [Ephydatia muelleri]